MTLGYNSGRLLAVTTGYLLSMGILFSFVVSLTSESTAALNNVKADELGLYTILVVMASLLIGVGMATKGWFFQSAQLWKHVCAVSITANVLIGAHNLAFGSLTKFGTSILEYSIQNYAGALFVSTIVGTGLYISIEKSGGTIKESVVQPFIALLLLSGVSTLLFAVNPSYALIALAAFLCGLTLHLRQRKKGKKKASAQEDSNVDGLDDAPVVSRLQSGGPFR